MRRLLKDGQVRQVMREVYVDSRAPDDLATRIAAVDLVRPPDAVLGRRTAAWLNGVPTDDISRRGPVPVDCIVPPGRTPIRRPGVRCWTAPLLDDVELIDGVPCTSPVRTALDLLRYDPPHLALATADALSHAGLFQAADLYLRAEEWIGGRNIRRARELAACCEPLAESFAESWLRLRILDAGFPRPVAQVPLGVDGRVEYRLDLGYPDRRLGIEYDGLDFHGDAEQRRHDTHRRDRIREVFGWQVLAVGRGEVLGRSLALEYGLGELLGIEPRTRKRRW